MGNKCHISPAFTLNLPPNVSIKCGVLYRHLSSQKYKIPFNGSSCNSSPLSPPQYSIMTNTVRSLISFLCFSYFILPGFSSKSSSTTISASPEKPKFFLLMLPVCFLLPHINFSNHVPLVVVVVTAIFFSALSRVSDPSTRTPALQIFPYAAEYLLVLSQCR